MAGATLADWLALNGLSARECRGLLMLPEGDAPPRPSDPPYPVDGLIDAVTSALSATLPRLSSLIDDIRTEVRIDLHPDRVRFPRAFTLHDDGRALPFISCPTKGLVSDVLLLGHEVGHALQILASRSPTFPPIQRETTAYLAEELVILGTATVDAHLGRELRDLHRARTHRIMRRSGSELRAALDTPNAPYSYNWNYPIARLLAARAIGKLGVTHLPSVFDGTVGTADLIKSSDS